MGSIYQDAGLSLAIVWQINYLRQGIIPKYYGNLFEIAAHGAQAALERTLRTCSFSETELLVHVAKRLRSVDADLNLLEPIEECAERYAAAFLADDFSGPQEAVI